MTTHAIRPAVLALLLVTPALLAGRQAAPPAPTPAAAGDMVDRIFKAREFSPPPAAAPAWLDGGAAYTRTEPVADRDGEVNIVRYDSATGTRRDVLISAAQLTPPGARSPLEVEDLSWS